MPPRITLSKMQWRGLLNRLLRAGPTAEMTDPAAKEILGHFEPPATKRLTTINEKIPLSGITEPVEQLSPDLYRLQPRRMAYEDALSQYMESPGKFGPPTGRGLAPPADVLSKVEPGSPEELAKGWSYNKYTMEPFQLPGGLQRTATELRRQEYSEGIDKGMQKLGVAPEDISIAPKDYLKQQGEQISPPPIAEVVQRAAIAEMLWQEASGGHYHKSTTTKIWKGLLDKQKPAVKDLYRNGKDYFLYCFRQYDKSPGIFKQKRPDEARLIEQMYNTLDETLGGAD